MTTEDDLRDWKDRIVEDGAEFVRELLERVTDDETDAATFSLMLPMFQKIGDAVGTLHVSMSALVAILIIKGIITDEEYERAKALLTSVSDQVQAGANEELQKKVRGDDDGS